ncbi:MAG: selenocysteine-specific translation elongation factor [Candidatus Cloacimonadales bacterium]
MKHLILGTAGHVDHGKTSLVRALTGFDCDTHSEEQNRGITIHLGFTYLNLDEEHQIGVIDVPGHKDFVNTMISGASGIDFVMLVIAADSGIMPQTSEHLKIMQLLQIKTGFVALTKTDLVDEELIELAKLEIEEFTENTFLADCPIIEVSTKTGVGLEAVKAEIIKQIDQAEQRDLKIIFRMYIDRIFTAEGYGTIVNGTVLSGKLQKEDEIIILPNRKSVRIRGMQKFKKETFEIFAGDRASLNIVGLKRDEFKRGMLISNHDRKQSVMIDCYLENFSNKPLQLWSTVIFLSGTFKTKARVHLIDCDKLEPQASALIQIDLDFPGILYYDDKFIIRDSSNDYTIGGGRIIDAFPLKHKKRPAALIERMKLLASQELKYVVLNEVEKSNDVVDSKELSFRLNLSQGAVKSLANEVSDKVAIIQQNDKELYILNELQEKLNHEITNIIRRHHLQNNLSNQGPTLSDITKHITFSQGSLNKSVISVILEDLILKNIIKKEAETYCLFTHNVDHNSSLSIKKDEVLSYIDGIGFDIPEENTKENIQKKFSLKGQEINSILNYLSEANQILFYDNIYVSLTVLRKIYAMLKSNFSDQEFKISEFRDLLGTNRKIALYFLEIFDKRGITQRKEEVRILTNKEMI